MCLTRAGLAPLHTHRDSRPHRHLVERALEKCSASRWPSRALVRVRLNRASVARLPNTGLLLVHAASRLMLAVQQASALVLAQVAAELRRAVTGRSTQRAFSVPPEHGYTTVQHRVLGQPIHRAGQHVARGGAHEVLAESGTYPARPDPL